MVNIEEHILVWNRHFPLQDLAIDCDGRCIKKSDYGIRGAYGWEIDHTVPTAFGGLDIYANKRPRHWLGNSRAGGFIGNFLNPTSRKY